MRPPLCRLIPTVLPWQYLWSPTTAQNDPTSLLCFLLPLLLCKPAKEGALVYRMSMPHFLLLRSLLAGCRFFRRWHPEICRRWSSLFYLCFSPLVWVKNQLTCWHSWKEQESISDRCPLSLREEHKTSGSLFSRVGRSIKHGRSLLLVLESCGNLDNRFAGGLWSCFTNKPKPFCLCSI